MYEPGKIGKKTKPRQYARYTDIERERNSKQTGATYVETRNNRIVSIAIDLNRDSEITIAKSR
jgi:hypothetical protein